MPLPTICLLAALFGCAAAEPTAAPEAAPEAPGPSSPGWLLIDQPGHAGYEASLYELSADGTITLTGTYVSHGGDFHERPDLAIGTVASGDVQCAFGGRYAMASPTRIAVDGVCSDGRERRVELELTPAGGEDRFGITILSVGGETGWTHPGQPWSLRRCSSRATCLEGIPLAGCSGVTISVLPLPDGKASLQVEGTSYVARAVPVVATVGGREVMALVTSAGGISAELPVVPVAGDTVEIAYVDGTEPLRCPIP